MDCAAPEPGSGIRRTDYYVQGPPARLIEKHIKTDGKNPVRRRHAVWYGLYTDLPPDSRNRWPLRLSGIKKYHRKTYLQKTIHTLPYVFSLRSHRDARRRLRFLCPEKRQYYNHRLRGASVREAAPSRRRLSSACREITS